jgi:RNA polymerase sigma factor (sigma-70 family)
MDEQLLERFITRRDEGAFADLVTRHGPMVLGVCRNVLGNRQDAEDAFQATFLALARRAGSIRNPAALGAWLFGVARRIALRARRAASHHRAHEGAGQNAPPEVEEPVVVLIRHEVRMALYDEIERLPERYRLPVVLCYLEGRSHDEAAHQLGWPLGTVKGRLARARQRLQDRLTPRLARGDLDIIASLCAATQARQTATAVPVALVSATVAAAVRFADGVAVGAGLARAALWAEGVGRSPPAVAPMAGVVVRALDAVLAGTYRLTRWVRRGPGHDRDRAGEPPPRVPPGR